VLLLHKLSLALPLCIDFPFDCTTADAICLIILLGKFSDSVSRCTEKKRATWNVGSISDVSENGVKGCVRAKFDLGSTPSGPHLAALSFTCEGTTFSGVNLELLGSGYRLSLVKKRIVSGESNCPFEICFEFVMKYIV